MSLAVFKEKILNEASAEAESIVQKNSFLISEEQNRASKDIRDMEEAIISVAQKQAQLQARSITQNAKLAGRSNILRAKQEELNAIKAEFLSSLTKLSDAKKKTIYKSLLRLVPKHRGEVISEKDGNGFVFRDKGIEMNLTLPYLVEQVFWKYRSELAKELFM